MGNLLSTISDNIYNITNVYYYSSRIDKNKKYI